MKIIYSFNKRGFEADYWTKEIAGASTDRYAFIPFNHDPYVEVTRYSRAQLLDNLYFDRDRGLMQMYDDLQDLVARTAAEALIVDNCFPYHPDWLRKQGIYKVLRTSDGPLLAYDRDIPYVHAYDHVLYHSPAYSRDLDMAEKLAYVGAKRADFWPLGLFAANHSPWKTEEQVFLQPRDIDVIFVGAMHLNKMPGLAKVKKAFGSRIRMHGLTSIKRNLYFNIRHGFPGWIRPIPFEEYSSLYQRARIGINLHNRGDYSVGNYRCFDLPGNGVMQISDGGKHLSRFFDVGTEVEGYKSVEELIDKVRYYLVHEDERQSIARAGYRRVVRDYRIAKLLHRAASLIHEGISRSRRPLTLGALNTSPVTGE